MSADICPTWKGPDKVTSPPPPPPSPLSPPSLLPVLPPSGFGDELPPEVSSVSVKIQPPVHGARSAKHAKIDSDVPFIITMASPPVGSHRNERATVVPRN